MLIVFSLLIYDQDMNSTENLQKNPMNPDFPWSQNSDSEKFGMVFEFNCTVKKT